jgi:hypothetical protein
MKLFRGKLATGSQTITNNTSKNLVIDFVNAAGNGLVLVVNAPSGEQHDYIFAGIELHGTQTGVIVYQVAQLTKIILKPGETLVQSGIGSAEVTGHYE